MKKVTRLSILILSLSLMLTACVRKVGWVGMNYGGKMKASYQL
jgi:starvation-inducible outer membrane lipoprotein